MPVPPELKKKLEQEGIVGVSDPEFDRKIRVYVETEEDAKRVLMEMPEVKVAGVSIKTEPIVSGRFYALARTERVRPIIGGISCGNYKITAGTLGLIVRDKTTKKPLILSNNHVLTQVINGIEGEIGDPILQPGSYDGGTENDIVAKLLRFVTIKLPPETNLVDAAVAEIVEGIDFKEFEIMDIGKVTGIAEAKEGERIYKSGRTSGLTQSTIFDTRATIKVYGYYSPDNYAIFEDQLISSTPFMAPGDSITGEARMFYKENGVLKYGTVEEVYNSFRSGNSIEVLTVKKACQNYPNGYPSMKTGVPCFSKIVDAVYHGIKPVWRVTLNNGKTIEVTKDHSLFTLSPRYMTNQFTTKTLEEIDNVISVDNYLFEGKEIDVDDDMLVFLGLWMADGSYIKKEGRIEGVSISTGKEKGIVKFLSEFSKKIGVNLRYKSKGDYRIHSEKLGRFVYSFFGDCYSETKRVPNIMFTSTKRQIGLFLKGYFSGDGSIYLHRDKVVVTCASVNRALLEDIQELLCRLGIKSNIDSGYVPTKLSKNRQYKLRIEGKLDVERFLNYIGFIKEIKQELFEILSRQNLRRKRDFYFTTSGIRSIEFVGEKHVYDFKVNPTESFVANGILCHNSGSIWVNERKEVVGLGFAGSDRFSCANKIQNVINLLDIEIPTARIATASAFPLLALAIIPNIYLMLKKS
jgi:intein/homing endonuclease